MGFSSAVSLGIFTLILVFSIGVYLNLVSQSIQLNDPSRISLISDHIRENINGWKDLDDRKILLESRWSGRSVIEYVLVIYRGSVVDRPIKVDPVITLDPLEVKSLTCEDLGLERYCDKVFGDGEMYSIIVVTGYGNSFPIL